MSKVSLIFILLLTGLSKNIISQNCCCELRYYYEAVDYIKDVESEHTILPYVTTIKYLNDSVYITRQDSCKYKLYKKRAKFDLSKSKLIRIDTFLVRNSEVYAIKSDKRFLIYSSDLFKNRKSTYSIDNIYVDSTNIKIGSIKNYFIPLKDTLIENKKGFLYKLGYVNNYIHYYDLTKNEYDTSFVELRRFFYIPGYGELYQFTDESYYKYTLISEDKNCKKHFMKIFGDYFKNN